MGINIVGEKIILAELKEEDAEKLHEYSKEPKLNEYSGPYKVSQSIEKAKEYIIDSRKNIEKNNSYILGIYEKETKEIVGTIGFFGLEEENKSGEIGFWVGKDFWNKGYMTEAVELLTKYIFKEIRYHRVFAHFHELNKAVERIFIKVGYKKEGELRDALKAKDGKYYKDMIYATVDSN